MAPVSQLVAIKLAFINKANYVTIALKVVFHALQRLTALNAITIWRLSMDHAIQTALMGLSITLRPQLVKVS
jgi:hypothetical protein